MNTENILSSVQVDEDAQYEAGLRPRQLDDYIGQDRVRENLIVAITAARNREEALDHVTSLMVHLSWQNYACLCDRK
ncbi:MAG: hypothetical protein Ct9H300mP25_15540 [Acidobacteriota bacterium]|nr:MAG: hypothetical protein Ct9H300mP25_15540 [Acidobacteriota bacterium]